MANLETLFIEIDGNASKASGGINDLIGSLSALGSEIGKQIGSIQSLASALKDIRSASVGGNIWKNLTPSGSGGSVSKLKQATTATKELTKAWAETHRIVPQHTGGFTGWGNGTIKQFDPATGGFTKTVTPNVPAAQSSGRMKAADALAMKKATVEVKQFDKAVKETASDTKEATKETKALAKATTNVGNSTKAATPKVTGLLKQIGRIAKTMLIRAAIRAVMKMAKQGLNNFYQYSKQIGSAYATAIDKLTAKATIGGNQIGAALGTLLTTLAPILNAIISVVTAAVEALTMLFALLGGSVTWTKATGGAEEFGKAVGGGGKAMKELLANFDELNVIASQGGGGGGGSGGGFGFEFKELELPQWMQEWKPLIEALVYGTLGALILPGIISGVKKLLDLFTGGGASTLLQILKYWFKKPTDDETPFSSFPTQPDYKPFPQQPTYHEFPVQPVYHEFPIAPDYGKAATDMGVIAAGATVAAPMIERIVAALGALSTGFSVLDTVKQLVATLLTKALGSTVKIKTDTKEYDTFKKDFAAWQKENKDVWIVLKVNADNYNGLKKTLDIWKKEIIYKTIAFKINSANFDGIKKTLSVWASTPVEKTIAFKVNSSNFDGVKRTLAEWVKETIYKNISFKIDLHSFRDVQRSVSEWVAETVYKQIAFKIDLTNFDGLKRTLSEWTKTVIYKKIAFKVDPANFDGVKRTLNEWIKVIAYKKIGIKVDSANYDGLKKTLNTFTGTVNTKTVKVEFDAKSWNAYAKKVREINNWVKDTASKTVSVTANTTVNIDSKIRATLTGLGRDMVEFLMGHKSLISVIIGAIQGGGESGGHGFANGGFPPQGDLFIANEQGAELVGSMGGKTTVANQQQIIEGIKEGVYAANSEQNALLRQQNELLRGILEKDNSVRLSASSALGRTVRQSLNMYNAVTGG